MTTWDELDSSSRAPLTTGRPVRVVIRGLAEDKDGAPVMKQDAGGTWKYAVAFDEVGGAGGGLEWFKLNKNNVWKLITVSKALGLSTDDMGSLTNGTTALPGKDDGPDAEVGQDTFEALVKGWTGREATVFAWYRLADKDGYPTVNWNGKDPKDSPKQAGQVDEERTYSTDEPPV